MSAALMRAPAPAPSAENARPALRLCQPDNAAAALGLAVAHLMTKPAFAPLGFGAWSRVLVGQVNRRHYQLVLDNRNRVVGFLGWALTTQANAEAWLEDRGGFNDAEAVEGDCVVLNTWSADTRAVNRLLLEAARWVGQGKRRLYGKRFYRDGSVRPVAMNVNDFIPANLGGLGGSGRPARGVLADAPSALALPYPRRGLLMGGTRSPPPPAAAPPRRP